MTRTLQDGDTTVFARNLHALIVHAEPLGCPAHARLLRDFGYVVDIAVGAREALQITQILPYELIVIDSAITGGITAMEAADRIRSGSGPCKEARIVVVGLAADLADPGSLVDALSGEVPGRNRATC